jgi:hypothetical protein
MPSLHTRLGFHYYPDDQHYTQVDLDTWLPVLQSLGARWITLRASLERAVPEPFLRGLQEAGIEPVVHMPLGVARLSEHELAPLLASYARWGLRYVVCFDRPNLRSSWSLAEWSRPGLVERYLDVLLPILQAQRAAGLQPVLPPLEPGGDYWDTAFLAATFEGLARRGQESLLSETTLAIYAWTCHKPLTWGAGGPALWPEARPYHTPEGAQDQRGLRAFDWYAAVARTADIPSLPMIVIAGGELPAAGEATIGPEAHVEQNVGIVRSLASGDIPASVLNFAFYALATSDDHPDHSAAWFPKLQEPRPVVAAMRRLIEAGPKARMSTIEKPIKHYLLLPPDRGASFLQRWQKLSEFTIAYHPAIGFSAEEARLAQHVTIAAETAEIPASVETELRSAGCTVERLIVADPGPASQPVAADALQATTVEIGECHA